ncbi:uncharacterized protein LOC113798625 [Dermatophagoides pteronyssinus]|uniref:uncharacterized protein LOC113798625 n=1 Tax=Dermatophagoides pteronyssinus TaxID=6956 RepID=UPI003F679F86
MLSNHLPSWIIIITIFLNIRSSSSSSLLIENIKPPPAEAATNPDEIILNSTRTHYQIIDSDLAKNDPISRIEIIFDTPVFQYENLILECRYRLNVDKKLYSIKWYKDDDEFFQYMPNDYPKVQHYNNKIITTMPEYEIGYNSFRLLLQNINIEYQGIYSCELSTDAPEFMTFKDYKLLEVYVLPNKSPRISGNKLNFLLKSRIDLNCTSPKSKPVSIIQWFINDQLAPNDYLIIYNTVNHTDGLQTRTVRLKFIVNEEHYQLGHMKLECVAIYRKLIIGENGTIVRIESSSVHHQESLTPNGQRRKPVIWTRRPNRFNTTTLSPILPTQSSSSTSSSLLALSLWYMVYMATISIIINSNNYYYG